MLSLPFAVLVGTALGAVIQGRASKEGGTPYTDTYDDLKPNAVPLLSKITTVNGLVPRPRAPAVPSPPLENIAAATMQTDQLFLASTTTQPFVTLTAVSGTFDLISFYYSCGVNDHTTIVVLQEGSALAVMGKYANGKDAPAFALSYSPTAATASRMALAKLPASYTRLHSVRISVATAEVAVAATVIGIDNLVHVNDP
ncbi:hypothetical protein LTR53_003194 [Teratosphaeriaceae sp. CCFEE 6253]|nr:hypothetical protein LTR53_003194 [Teratosphaeriaceae sp. CCFEE 6253]